MSEQEMAVAREHGYTAYSKGCRCEVCRAAKAAYHRGKRAAAMQAARPGRVVEGIKHGTRRGYKDHGCRCESCTTAMRAIWQRWSWAARHPESGAA